MEAMLLAFDCLALFILVFYSVKDDSRRPGTPSRGPFRYTEVLPEANAAAGEKKSGDKPGRRAPYA